VEHGVSELARELLAAARLQGLAPRYLAEKVAAPQAAVEAVLDELRERGLLFEEDGRVIALAGDTPEWLEACSLRHEALAATTAGAGRAAHEGRP
jgi:hypothetical protein